MAMPSWMSLVKSCLQRGDFRRSARIDKGRRLRRTANRLPVAAEILEFRQMLSVTAVADTVSINRANTPLTIDVLRNDTAQQGDTPHIVAFTQAAHGTVALVAADPNGSGPALRDRLVVTPNAGYTGTQSFSYTVDDGHGHQSSASVGVTIAPSQGASTDPLAPSVGGFGFIVDPRYDFTPAVTGNYSISVVTSGGYSHTWTEGDNFRPGVGAGQNDLTTTIVA
jgi:hypothetical protein